MATKNSFVVYYSYENEEFADLTLEEIGALILGCIAYDQNKEIRKDAKKVIDNDRTVRTVFRDLKGKTGRATKKWHDENKRREEGKLIKDIMAEYNCTKEEAKEILKKLKENNSDVVSGTTTDVTTDIITDTVSADNPNLLSKEYVFQFQIATDPDLPFQFQDFDIVAEYEKEYENNLPTEEELTDNSLKELETEDEKIRFLNNLFNNGNADGWKKEWYEYLESEAKNNEDKTKER